MKRIALVLTAAVTFTVPAFAADMAAKAPMRAAPVAYAPSWTGCYLGGGGGYGLWNQDNTVFDDGPPRTLNTRTTTAGGRGWFGTVQGGCDYQFGLGNWNLLIGGFGDYDFADIKGELGTLGQAIVGREKMSSAWSAGGRIGWVVTPNLMTYFSGGYTEATFDRVTFLDSFSGLIDGRHLDKNTYHGWFLGAGDEYSLGFLPGLFWKTEYRVSEFDVKTNPFRDNVTNLPTGLSVDSKKWVQSIRSELVYRFNWGGAPVAARY